MKRFGVMMFSSYLHLCRSCLWNTVLLYYVIFQLFECLGSFDQSWLCACAEILLVKYSCVVLCHFSVIWMRWIVWPSPTMCPQNRTSFGQEWRPQELLRHISHLKTYTLSKKLVPSIISHLKTYTLSKKLIPSIISQINIYTWSVEVCYLFHFQFQYLRIALLMRKDSWITSHFKGALFK